MGPLSPSKLGLPLSSLSIDDGQYDIVSGEEAESPTKSTTLPPDSRKKFSFSTRSPSPTSAKRSERKGFLRKRSGSFDSHSMLGTKKN